MTMHTRLCGIFLLLLIPSLASALGLGKLQLNSALNEPFDARIRLLSPTAAELDSLEVGLADSAAFARVNMDRPAVLGRLRFTLDRADRGADTIHITSADPIREPFLQFLIEINWSNGRLFREYTVLLDPPLYDPDKRITEFSPAATRAAPPRPAPPRPAAPRPEPRAAADNIASGGINYSGGDYGPIIANDTLWDIASATRPSASISVNQMMLALLRGNPDAFITQNINGLKSGWILRMPTESEINAVGGATDILTEVLAQHAAWQAAREAAAGERPEPGLTTAALTADMPSFPASAPAAPDSELRLVSLNNMAGANLQAGAAVGDGQDLILARESIESLKQENLALMDRLTENENLIADLQRLLSLKDSEMAALQAQLGRAEAMAAEAEAAVEARAAPAPASGQETMPSAATEGTDAGTLSAYFGALKDILTANPLATLVGAGLLVLILLLLRFRKGRATETDAMSADLDAWGMRAGRGGAAARARVSSADNSGQETDSPATDTDLTNSGAGGRKGKTASPATKAVGVIVEEGREEDPSHEVNTYLAFEQFHQAEEIARDAIAAQPDNPEFHIKLLEVFYTSGNTGAYEEAIRALHELTGGEGKHWETAIAMWSKMSPERALFAGEQAKTDEHEVTADTDEKPRDVTDITPISGLPVDSASGKEAGQSAEATAEKKGGIATAPEPDEARAADQISTAPEQTPEADVDIDIDLDLSELDTASKPLAAADGGANDGIDLDLSEFDNTPSHTTDATPHAESRPAELSAEDAAAPAGDTGAGAAQLTMDDEDELETVQIPRADKPPEQSLEDQIATQLDLARAYIEIGDKQNARGILDEVMASGNAEQKQQAEALAGQI